MTVTVKPKSELIVPRSVRRRAGIKVGDRIEFKVSGGIINIVPRLPPADDDYTPQQRRIVDRALAEGLDDIKQDRLYGPFETHETMLDFLYSQANTRRTSRARGKPKKPPKGR